MRNRAPLTPNQFDPLPLGAIEPRGWLRDQLEIQAKGLTGHLDEFWADVSQKSAWLGGDGEAWERGPYFVDGLLPLAYELKDQKLIEKANAWVEWTLTHQRPDGEIGPTSNSDWWPRMVMLKVLTQYEEATGDPRVEPLMTRYFTYELAELPKRPLTSWGRYRWQDNVLTVLWLYNRTGDPRLMELARLLREQGFDWKESFKSFPFKGKQTAQSLGLDRTHDNTDRAMQAHGVNNAMALKASPLSYVLTGHAGDRAAVYQQIGELERYHLLPNGMYSGDEHLAGDNPSQGVELCTVVESMFSWELNLAVLGDARFADRLERIAFNALPGTISDDMWSHQYDQQPNQVACTRGQRQWSSNGPDSNLFGLEPHFGCCTANMHQGWPKFAESLWMGTADGGLVATAYAPNRVTIELPGKESGAHQPKTFTLDEETNYPFDGMLRFTVHTGRPASLPIVLRIPGWAAAAKLTINDGATETIRPGCPQAAYDGRLHGSGANGTPDGCLFHTIRRTWKEGDRFELLLPLEPKVTRWYRGSVAVERGPLLFSLKMEQDWKKLDQHAELSADWQITSETPWNYALAVDANNPGRTISVKTDLLGPVPFSSQQVPVQLTVYGRLDPAWTLFEGSAGPLPESPVSSSAPLVPLVLVPYAAAKLRITAFPLLDMPENRAEVQSH
ncbi:beta-L-arabinofuranosidase domain-containing protein [Granulicella tundricola]|uniref:beta-L-arabinofuranosidase domain-containing protein n=1 Tax=Granulicella tundricola TaxID=940615 RepID=UPI0018DDDEBA|nr:beta-L-arabinofuranosidase domain-containing protein [Granulicella tundricola]